MDARQTPVLTVIAMCYNHARFLNDCLDSIRRQTEADFQLIVTDDCSTDGSVEKIHRWLELNAFPALVIRNERNIGLCSTLNRALTEVTGEFVSMISTDDVWEPWKLEVQLRRFRDCPASVAMVYSDASLMNEQGELLPRTFLEEHWPGLTPPSGNIFHALAERNFIPAMATMIRTSCLQQSGGYDESLAYEDYDMWLRIARKYAVEYVDELVARYRLLSNSLGGTLFRGATRPSRTLLSSCMIGRKLLKAGGLQPEQREQWVSQMFYDALELYLRKQPEASQFLWMSGLRSRSIRRVGLAVAASLRVPPRVILALQPIRSDGTRSDS